MSGPAGAADGAACCRHGLDEHDPGGATVLTEFGEHLQDALRRGELWLVHMARFGDVASMAACAQALIGSHVRDGAALAIDPVDGGFMLRLTRRMVAGEADIHEPVRTVMQTHGGRYVTAGSR